MPCGERQLLNSAGLVGEDTVDVPLAKRIDERLNGHNYAGSLDIAPSTHRPTAGRSGFSTSGVRSDRVPSYYSTIVGPPDETARIAVDKVKADTHGFRSRSADGI